MYDVTTKKGGEELLKRARKATSRVPYSLREDIAQELVLAYLDGQITLEEMEARARTLVNKYLRETEARHTDSLDAPLYGDSDVTLLANLTQEDVSRRLTYIWYGSGGFFSLCSCVACRAPMYKIGLSSAGKQRFRCLSCGATGVAHTSRSRYFDDERQLRVLTLLRAGQSIRDVARQVGMNPNTVMKYRKLLRPDEIAPCGCGKAAGHKGWCWWRLKQKPQRRSFMRRVRQPQDSRA